jgi:FRG domain
MSILVTPTVVTSWPDLRDKLATYDQRWAFRGVANADWELKSSLERLLVSPLLESERYLLTTFQRRAHHYVRDCPSLNDYAEWFALMQHHGAPTRLLDCTRSPYIALFFAVERRAAPVPAVQAAVWVIDVEACKQAAIDILVPQNSDRTLSLGKPDTFKEAFMREHEMGGLQSQLCVAPIQPFRMNERLTIQQGLFLCPAQVNSSFEDNLSAMSIKGAKFEKYVFDMSLRGEILSELKKMNITRASLFPGIDGFAQSLGLNVEIATMTGKLSTEIKRLDAYAEYGF